MQDTFDVYLGKKLIDTLIYSSRVKPDREDVKRSLIVHDGYPDNIRVVKRRSPANKGQNAETD